jgi:hypothetical protein
MKKYLLILITFLTTAFSVTAQDDLPEGGAKRQEKIRALYVAFITEKLVLTPDEAQKFWPVHTQFSNELKGVNKDLPELQKQQAQLDIKKKYQDGFNRILGNQRTERFFKLDGEFKQKLLDQFKKRQNNRGGGMMMRRQ